MGNNPDIFALKETTPRTSFHLPFQNFTNNGFSDLGL